MLESVNAVISDGPAGNEEPDRIDALLSSALADQARERRMLVDTVFGAKSALVKAEEEMSALREAMDKRDQSLLEEVRKSNEALVESLTAKVDEALKSRPKVPRDAGLTLRIEAIEDGILQLAQRIAELPTVIRKEMEELAAQVRRDLEVSAGAIGDRIGEESGSLLNDIREDQVEVVQTLARMSESTASDLRQAVTRSQQEIMERVASAARDGIEASASSVEQMVEHLTGYLQARDEQLYRARDQRLVELFQQLSDTIGRTTKRKIGKIMEGEGGSSPKALGPPVPPVKAPPPLSVNRSFRSSAADKTEVTRSSFPPPAAGPAVNEPSPGRPDPAFLFDDPAERSRDEAGPPEPPDDDPFEVVPVPYFDRPGDRPRRPQPLGELGGPSDASIKQSLGNPLSRAELARDYLLQPPSGPFGDEPVGGRRPIPADPADIPPKRRSGRGPDRSSGPPAPGRGRRKN